jgi:undecaprenyl-phosphate galactose phosphotransferase
MTIFKKYPPFKFILAFLDLLVLNASFAIALRLRFMPHIDVINIPEFKIAQEWAIFIPYSLLWIVIFQYLGLYKRHIIFTKSKQTVLITKGIIIGFIILIIAQFIIRPSVMLDSRLMLIYFLLLCTVLLISYRLLLIRPIFRSKWLGNLLSENVLIIGAGKRGKLLASKIMEEQEFQSKVIGFLDDNIERGMIVFQDFKILGKLDDIKWVIEYYRVNSVYLAIDNISKNRLYSIISDALQYNSYIHVSSEIMEILPAKLNLDKVKDLPVVRSNSSFDGAYNRYFKRILDVLFTSVGVVIISPFLLFIAIGVKLSSPGPIIFKQKRLGENGKFFDFYKFRSMVVGSDNDESRKKEMIDLIKGNNNNSNGGSTKVVNPSRITKFGKFIRKYSFDELPQLFNVIKGDMSLVGPRPCLPYEYEVYDDWHKRRLSVKPGCTGLWQVTSRSETSYDDMVILDIYYLQNISPWFDLQLLLKTIPVLLTGKGGE